MSSSQNAQIHRYSPVEEIVNSITHGIGAGLSVVGLVVLVVCAALYGDAWHIVSFSIFGGTLIVLYASSTLYHSFSNPTAKTVLKKIDHSAIFFLIAGTYTPFVLVSLRGAWGWSLFGIVWTLVLIGTTIKFVSIFRFQRLFVAIYVLMGWLGLVAIREIVISVPFPSIILLVMGGLAYTTGVLFYSCRKLPFNHGIWHIFVLFGSAFHYFSVLYILKQE